MRSHRHSPSPDPYHIPTLPPIKNLTCTNRSADGSAHVLPAAVLIAKNPVQLLVAALVAALLSRQGVRLPSIHNKRRIQSNFAVLIQ